MTKIPALEVLKEVYFKYILICTFVKTGFVRRSARHINILPYLKSMVFPSLFLLRNSKALAALQVLVFSFIKFMMRV